MFLKCLWTMKLKTGPIWTKSGSLEHIHDKGFRHRELKLRPVDYHFLISTELKRHKNIGAFTSQDLRLGPRIIHPGYKL